MPDVETPVVLQRQNRYNPYCSKCLQHKGLLYHDTEEHDQAVEMLNHLNRKFNKPETD